MSETSTPVPAEIRAPRGARLLEIDWSDGETAVYEHLVLRAFCPCAHCQGHQGPVQWVEGTENADARALELVDLAEVGQYALSLRWGDGHGTGIYTFRYLRELAGAFRTDRAKLRELVFER